MQTERTKRPGRFVPFNKMQSLLERKASIEAERPVGHSQRTLDCKHANKKGSGMSKFFEGMAHQVEEGKQLEITPIEISAFF